MRPGRRTTRPRCCIWRCVSRGLTLRHKAAGHTLSSRLGLPQGSGMEGSLDSAHSVRCARDDKGQSLPPLGSRRKRGERMCPGLCPASVSVTVSVAGIVNGGWRKRCWACHSLSKIDRSYWMCGNLNGFAAASGAGLRFTRCFGAEARIGKERVVRKGK